MMIPPFKVFEFFIGEKEPYEIGLKVRSYR